jgi:hypothetical protein
MFEKTAITGIFFWNYVIYVTNSVATLVALGIFGNDWLNATALLHIIFVWNYILSTSCLKTVYLVQIE